MLSIMLFLLSPLPLRAQDTSPTNSGAETSFLEALVNAVRDFFAGFSKGGDQADDSGNDSGNSQPLAAADSDTTAPSTDASPTNPPVAAARAMDSQSGDGGGSRTAGTINPDALARTIASDAGGHADQYDNYSERLAATLSKMTAEQRSRIFAAN